MIPFTQLASKAVPMPDSDIDTDRILPSRFMQKPRAAGFGNYLFYDLRFDSQGRDRPDFILGDSRYREARILLAGPNFGCGSSREQAVYAIYDHGFRVVIAPSFGDIFYMNALKNGLLPVILPRHSVDEMLRQCVIDPALQFTIDLEQQTVSCAQGPRHAFPIDAFNKQLLLSGQDEIDFTLARIADIAAFEARRAGTNAWL